MKENMTSQSYGVNHMKSENKEINPSREYFYITNDSKAKTSKNQSRETAQWIMVLGVKPENLSSILGTLAVL